MRQRFGAQRICAVADRGMISAAAIEHLEQSAADSSWRAHAPHPRGARQVLKHRGASRVHPHSPDSKAPSPLKSRVVGDRRYIVCRNEAQAEKDQHDREAIVQALEPRSSAARRA